MRFDKAAFWFVQSKEHFAFPEKRRFGRIQIFRRFCIALQKPTAERDHFANIVANWKHDSASKTIVNVTLRAFLIAQFYQPALQKVTSRMTTTERPFQKRVPTLRRVAELPIFSHLPIYTPLLQIFACRLSEFLLQQIVVKPLGRFRMQSDQPRARFAVSIFTCAALFGNGNSRTRGQLANS